MRHVDTLQPPFSLLRRGPPQDLLPWCEAHGTRMLVYSLMEIGLLTGRFDAAAVRSVPAGDYRRQHPEFQEPAVSRNLALVERLRPVARRLGCSLAELAVAWTLARPGVTAAIAGGRRPEQLGGWIHAPRVQLSKSDLDEIAAAIAATGAGSGPARPAAALSCLRFRQ